MMRPETEASAIPKKSLVTLQMFHIRLPLFQIDSATPNEPKLFIIIGYKYFVCINVLF